ncbi:hypothetical protein [Nocardioides sp.]|uniref:hypothetical protein n=1 Tax=Nocardioides sp. TaxID=35761 RepID=UPI002B26F5B8|nr:hypothetical protein [Nocardioides sp.]
MTRRRRFLGQGAEFVLVLAVFAAVGAAAGWLWERWWSPITGVVVDGTWVAGYRPEGDGFVFDFPSLENFFDGTAQYVVIGVLAGLVLGVVFSLLGRGSELVMLVAVVAGSALAGYVAYRLGTHLGPPDPTTLEAAAADGTTLPGDLTVEGASPFVAWPLGALIGLSVTYLLTTSRAHTHARGASGPVWIDEGPRAADRV